MTPIDANGRDALLSRYDEANALLGEQPPAELRARVLAFASEQARAPTPEALMQAPSKEPVAPASPTSPTSPPRTAANESRWLLRAMGSLAMVGVIGFVVVQFDPREARIQVAQAPAHPSTTANVDGLNARADAQADSVAQPAAGAAAPAEQANAVVAHVDPTAQTKQAPRTTQADTQSWTVAQADADADADAASASSARSSVKRSTRASPGTTDAAADNGQNAESAEHQLTKQTATAQARIATSRPATANADAALHAQAQPHAQLPARAKAPSVAAATSDMAPMTEMAPAAAAAPTISAAPSAAPAIAAAPVAGMPALATAASAPARRATANVARTGTGGQFAADARLRQAAQRGDVIAVQREAQAGSPVDAPDAQGRTALMLAALRGDLPMVRALLALGASRTARDAQGQSALDLAQAHGHAAVVHALE